MLRKLSQLAIAIILAGGLVSLALLSIQNVTPVSLQFLMFRSIQLPVGLLLVGCVAMGIVMGGVLPILSGGGKRRQPSARQREREEAFDDLL